MGLQVLCLTRSNFQDSLNLVQYFAFLKLFSSSENYYNIELYLKYCIKYNYSLKYKIRKYNIKNLQYIIDKKLLFFFNIIEKCEYL